MKPLFHSRRIDSCDSTTIYNWLLFYGTFLQKMMDVFISKYEVYNICGFSMTSQNENLVLKRINQLEEKINRIEQLLLFLMEEEYQLSEEEIARIAEADKIIKEKTYDQLIPVK